MKVVYKIYLNNIELYFDSVPNAQIRDSLKNNSWRWIKNKKCWSNKNTPANFNYAKGLYEEFCLDKSLKNLPFGMRVKKVICDHTNYFPEDIKIGSFSDFSCCEDVELQQSRRLICISSGNKSLDISGYFCPKCHRLFILKSEIIRINTNRNNEILGLPFKIVDVSYYKNGSQFIIEPIRVFEEVTYREKYDKNLKLFLIMRSFMFNIDISKVHSVLNSYGYTLDDINTSVVNTLMDTELLKLFKVNSISELCSLSINSLKDYMHKIMYTKILEDVYIENKKDSKLNYVVFKYLVSDTMTLYFKLLCSSEVYSKEKDQIDFLTDSITISFKCSKCKKIITYQLEHDDYGYQILCDMQKFEEFVETERTRNDFEYDDSIKLLDTADFLVRSTSLGCVFKDHHLIRINAAVNIQSAKRLYEAQVPAAYCEKCDRYYILERYYEKLKTYGYICCQIDTFDSVKKHSKKGFSNFQEKSILALYGYNVDKKKDLSEQERHSILDFIIDNKIQTKYEVISRLEGNISLRKHNPDYQLAISKWETDIEYVRKKQKVNAIVIAKSFKVPVERIIIN